MQQHNSFQGSRRPQKPVDALHGSQASRGTVHPKPTLPQGIGAFEGIVAREQAPKGNQARGVHAAQGQKRSGQPVGQSRVVKTSDGVTKPQGQKGQRPASEKRSRAPRSGGAGGRRNNRRFQPAVSNRLEPKKLGAAIPAIPEKTLRIIPLGGQEEVGRNMTVFEYGDDIVIIDMGVQFPEEDMPGIDYIVPNVSYLKGKEKNIRGVLFTHGHLDHIGAAPILLKQLNYPTIIGRDFTLALIKHKVEDQEKGAASRLKTVRVKSLDDRIRLGVFEVRFFEVEHSIMDAMGIALVTPNGSIIHLGDWMISNEPVEPNDVSYNHLDSLPKPTFLMLESLGATKKGMPPSETEVHTNLQNLIRTAPGRIIIGTFASQVRRIAYLIEYAEKQGKRVALEG